MKLYVARREPMTAASWRKLGWDEKTAQEMLAEGQTEPRVYVQELDPAGQVYRERELEHHVLHSPDGFEWGYSGSGPAELARSILIDHLGGLDALERNAFGEPVVPAYQEFKRQFIAPAPAEGLVISDVEIEAWMVLERAALEL